jgi:HEAT repeat protein
MRCEDTSPKLADYLSGTLPDAERQALESHALACPACREELEGASEMWQRLGRLPGTPADSRGMRARFDAMMAEASQTGADGAEVTHSGTGAPLPARAQPAPQSVAAPSVRTRTNRWMRRHRTVRPLLQACAAAILLVAGIQVGRQMAPPPAAAPDVTALRDEVRDLRQMMTLSLMQQQSVTERLKGVSWSSQLDQPGNEVVSALIDTLMHDGNVNVRLASIDALKRFAEREVVRDATVRALDTQTSPLVQMALIDFVVETQDRAALDALRRLSKDDMANEAVRARASWGIEHLEAA